MPDPTAEQLARESGEAIANAIADNLEAVILRLTDAIATLQREQAELRDELHSLSGEVARLRASHPLAEGWATAANPYYKAP